MYWPFARSQSTDPGVACAPPSSANLRTVDPAPASLDRDES
jgi:hypothetical protein